MYVLRRRRRQSGSRAENNLFTCEPTEQKRRKNRSEKIEFRTTRSCLPSKTSCEIVNWIELNGPEVPRLVPFSQQVIAEAKYRSVSSSLLLYCLCRVWYLVIGATNRTNPNRISFHELTPGFWILLSPDFLHELVPGQSVTSTHTKGRGPRGEASLVNVNRVGCIGTWNDLVLDQRLSLREFFLNSCTKTKGAQPKRQNNHIYIPRLFALVGWMGGEKWKKRTSRENYRGCRIFFLDGSRRNSTPVGMLG